MVSHPGKIQYDDVNVGVQLYTCCALHHQLQWETCHSSGDNGSVQEHGRLFILNHFVKVGQVKKAQWIVEEVGDEWEAVKGGVSDIFSKESRGW